MRTTRTTRKRLRCHILLLLFLIPILLATTAQADSVQGYTIQAEHAIVFVGDSMNISATGPSMGFVSLIFYNDSGNRTNTFLLQLNYSGEGVRHISTDNMKAGVYRIDLGVMNPETKEIDVVANTTVSLVYDPVHILQKQLNQQEEKLQKLNEENLALHDELQQKYIAMRNDMIFAVGIVAMFFILMVLSVDWQGGLLSNRSAVVSHLPLWLEALWGGKQGAGRGIAWGKGIPPQWYSEALAAVTISHAERAFNELTASLQRYKELLKQGSSEQKLARLKAYNLRRRIKALNKIVNEWKEMDRPDYYDDVQERMKKRNKR